MYQLDSSHIWHVAKSGNNSNSGHAGQYPVNLANDAKLTIGAAISAASAGDTIIIWPGTYAENVTINKTLTLVGTSRRGCKIQVSSGNALTITADSCTIKSIEAITTASGIAYGIKGGGDYLEMIDCYGKGDYDGIHLNGSSYVRLFKCHGKGKFDGIQLGNGHNIIVDNCIAETDGTNTINNYTNALITDTCTGVIIRNTICYANRALNGDDYHLAACQIRGEVVLENVCCYSKHTGTGQHKTVGLYLGSSSVQMTAKNVAIKVEPTIGYGYGIEIIGGAAILNGATINIAEPTSFSGSVTSQVSGSEKTKFIDSNMYSVPDDYFNEWWVTWTSGNNEGEIKEVADWVQSTKEFTLASACTYDIEIGDEYIVKKYIKKDIKRTSGTLRVANCYYDSNAIEGTITSFDGIADADGRVDISKLNGSEDDLLRLNKATKLLTNKAIQNKSTGAIDYYDDDGETVILTHTPADGESEIERTPS